MTEEMLAAIREADLVLVGIGEEFDEIGVPRNTDSYKNDRACLEQNGELWLLPYYDKLHREEECNEKVLKGLTNLAELLKDKNYFVVSTAMNDMLKSVPWKDGRLVMPCGGFGKKQCADACEEGLQDLSGSDCRNIAVYMNLIMQNMAGADACSKGKLDIGVCPHCGKSLILNNIYAEKYDENGYLPQWNLYTKWLQGTLNKKLVIIELGVGMKFPSVIRWPFEKVAFFNNKAHMYRVNEKLYQLSEELKGKGTAIAKNSIDWLDSLC